MKPTKQSREMIRNGLLRPLHGLAMTYDVIAGATKVVLSHDVKLFSLWLLNAMCKENNIPIGKLLLDNYQLVLNE